MRKGTKTIIVSLLIAGSLVTGYMYRDKDMHIVEETVNQAMQKISDTYTALASVAEAELEDFKEPDAAEKTNKAKMAVIYDAPAATKDKLSIKEKFIQVAERIGAAQSKEDAAKWFAEGTDEDRLAQEYETFHNHNVVIKNAEYLREYQGDQVLFLEAEMDGEQVKGVYVVEETPLDGYRIFANGQAEADAIEQCLCSLCTGSGQIMNGHGTACGICGGSGQQYIPNLSYDQIMGWQGGYIGCGGCGGSGYIGTTWITCPSCGGKGVH